MSDIFFEELSIPKPEYNLGIAGGSHGKMTGAMLMAIEDVLTDEKPDWLLVYGDTNSTLAASLAAVKLHIPVCHVEAGNRLGTLTNPEEVNRICTDHVSQLLMCCTPSAVEFLRREGITNRVVLTGDPMYDAFLYYGERLPADVFAGVEDIDGQHISVPERYYYLTCHREENTASDQPLQQILTAMNQLDAPTIYPVHPRNFKQVCRLCAECGFNKIILTKPVGYLASLALVNGALKIVTDSGGLQREAFFAGKQCVTIFDYICWPETMIGNANQLAGADVADILNKLENSVKWDSMYQPFGNGRSAELITQTLTDMV
jgi:UDP-N-acetylglucosamine 2-epimerase (non-hydrolysing)/UDP-GlcNAc3NAcA epimerase